MQKVQVAQEVIKKWLLMIVRVSKVIKSDVQCLYSAPKTNQRRQGPKETGSTVNCRQQMVMSMP